MGSVSGPGGPPPIPPMGGQHGPGTEQLIDILKQLRGATDQFAHGNIGTGKFLKTCEDLQRQLEKLNLPNEPNFETNKQAVQDCFKELPAAMNYEFEEGFVADIDKTIDKLQKS